MTNLLMLNNINTHNYLMAGNLGSILLNNYADNVNSVRTELLKGVKSKSPDFHDGIVNILNRIANKGYGKSLPNLFEIFPWVLRDITDLDYHRTHEISVNWLALYLYVSLVDDYLDLKIEILPNELLGSSFLATDGLIKLFKIVNGTQYEKTFTDSLFSSARFQLSDVVNQSISYNDSFTKAESASGKNTILLACAGVVAASCKNNSQFVIELTEKLLLAIQLLDDLADFEEDLLRNNITIILNGLDDISVAQNEPITRYEILYKLISTGALWNVVSKIESLLITALHIIDQNTQLKRNPTTTKDFFTSILAEVKLLGGILIEFQEKFELLTKTEQTNIIEEVDKRIHKIYLHT